MIPLPVGPRPLLVIVGPTASGKSALALEWAEALGTEIISADSVQIHTELDIGSAKPTPSELARAPHHLVSVLPPTERPSAGFWLEKAEAAIATLHAKDLVPIVCGGTGLYVRALLEGLAEIPDIPPDVRATLLSRLETEGSAALHRELAVCDPDAAARIHPNDPQRITRALEVFMATGRPLSSFQRAHERAAPRYSVRIIGLFPDRDTLGRRIADRAKRMLDAGLIDEVSGILARHGADCPGLETLGYREVRDTLLGKSPVSDLEPRLVTAHRQYAKRQLTWWQKVHFDERRTGS
jgi:tRNA dimethylallyltransferase